MAIKAIFSDLGRQKVLSFIKRTLSKLFSLQMMHGISELYQEDHRV